MSETRQVRRATARATAKAAHRAPLKEASWGRGFGSRKARQGAISKRQYVGGRRVSLPAFRAHQAELSRLGLAA